MAAQSPITSKNTPTADEYDPRNLRARLRAFAPGQFVLVSKAFLHLMSCRDALALSILINWASKFPHLQKTDGWFFFTIKDFELESGMSQDVQEKAFKSLEGEGYIIKKRAGMPPKRYFKINIDVIEYRANIELDRVDYLKEEMRQERDKKLIEKAQTEVEV